MQLFAAAPDGGDQVRRLEHAEVLGHSLPRHVQVLAQLVERLTVVRVQKVEELAPAGVGQRPEEKIRVAAHMQVYTCMSDTTLSTDSDSCRGAPTEPGGLPTAWSDRTVPRTRRPHGCDAYFLPSTEALPMRRLYYLACPL